MYSSRNLLLMRPRLLLISFRYHLGQLKAKLAKLRRELIEPRSGSGGGASLPAFEVAKTGMASVGFVGFPSVVSRRVDERN
jgi:ribosome-interacting GTPase 1